METAAKRKNGSIIDAWQLRQTAKSFLAIKSKIITNLSKMSLGMQLGTTESEFYQRFEQTRHQKMNVTKKEWKIMKLLGRHTIISSQSHHI